MTKVLTRWLDLREEEGRVVLQAFVTLFLIVAAHTTLETARDALFLAKLPPSQLNVVYVVLAALTFFVAGGATRFAQRFGRRNALICSLVIAAYFTTLLHFMAPTPRVVLALYVFSGLVGAVLSPQFWMLAAKLFTAAQGRRLFGPIASGGVLGGVAGAGAAAAMVRAFPVTALLPLAATLFVATAIVLTTMTPAEDGPDEAASAPSREPDTTSWFSFFRQNPFLVRLAALAALMTAAVLVVDYLFKSTAARVVPVNELGSFFARYYAVVNGLSLVVQLVVAGRLIRRIGVIPTVGVMPLLLAGGAIGTMLVGGTLVVVMGLKAIDGGMRHSLNRVASELLYLPLPAAARERGKGVIDGVLGRVVQAATAAVLLLLTMRGLASPRVLAGIVVALAVGWLIVTISLRATYLDLFRKAIARDPFATRGAESELDLDGAGALVETLASPDPVRVVAAMDLLVENRREKLIPALVLYHDAPLVLERALALFGESKREDWTALAERHLSHPDTNVRVAAIRALARHGKVDALKTAIEDTSSRVQAYAAFHLAYREAGLDLLEHPLIMVIMGMPGDFGRENRLGLLAAIADSPDARATGVLLQLMTKRELDRSEEAMEHLGRAIAAIKDPRFIAPCIARLAIRVGRDAVRDALVALGDPAREALEQALREPKTPRRVRVHVPRSISRFGTQAASDFLVERLGVEQDGLVRYKTLRGLGQLVARYEVKVDRARVEKEVRRNLEDHLRLFAQRTALHAKGGDASLGTSSSGILLSGLLDDKMRQALERAFRLLKIAYKEEDIHRVHEAALAADKKARSNAGEFLDVLLARADQRELRALLRLVLDDAPDAQRAELAAEFVGAVPKTADDALAMLVDDHDDALAALAAHHALSLGRPKLRATVEKAQQARPLLEELGERLFGDVAPAMGGSHA